MRKKIAGALHIPEECVRKLAMSLAAVIVFLMAAVVPGSLVLGHLGKKIREVHRELDERSSLLPLYATLGKASNSGPVKIKISGKDPARPLAVIDGEPELAKTGLKLADLGGALMKIRDISRSSAMRDVNIDPDLNNAAGNAGQGAATFAVNVSFKGSFENFRTFLINIYALPYVENIASLSIEKEADGRTLDFGAKIMLAQS
ncbi:MAG: hypothetical protein M0Z75_00300 [Nitrospiraceae bacterium]|nr:hypothetical protein [Nitrospiraceae bacterium]